MLCALLHYPSAHGFGSLFVRSQRSSALVTGTKGADALAQEIGPEREGI